MKTIFWLFWNTKKGISHIQASYEDELSKQNTILFLVFGLITAITSLDILDYESYIGNWKYVFMAIEIITFSFVILVFCMILTYTIYKISKWQHGTGSYTDTEAIVAYGTITLICQQVLCRVAATIGIHKSTPIIILVLSHLFFVKMVFYGVRILNNFSLGKAFTSLSILWVFYAFLAFTQWLILFYYTQHY